MRAAVCGCSTSGVDPAGPYYVPRSLRDLFGESVRFALRVIAAMRVLARGFQVSVDFRHDVAMVGRGQRRESNSMVVP
jgi:hypothetical protein